MHRSIRHAGAFVAAVLLAWPVCTATETQRARAVWLWDARPALSDASARSAMFDFLGRERVALIWAQVDVQERDVTRAPAWRTFIAEGAERGIRVEALAGDPAWALQDAEPKGVLEAVLAYNVAAAAKERFSGIHFDIEPHQLWSWRSAKNRKQALRKYLDLLAWCKERMAYEFPGMVLGADIPFWWQAKDARSNKAIGDVEFNGVTKAASFHVIDVLDNVGIMSYRNRADGPNGMVAISQDVLNYADRATHAALWMGVETSRDKPGTVWFALGLPSAAAAALLDSATDISEGRRYKGYRVSVFDDGTRTHVGLSVPDAERDSPSPALTSAMASLARTFGMPAAPPGTKDNPDQIHAALVTRMGRDPEWQDPRSKPIVDPGTGTAFPGLLARSVMPASLTFEGSSADAFRRETGAAEQAFATHASFRGLAIHHFDSFRALVGRQAPTLPFPRPFGN